MPNQEPNDLISLHHHFDGQIIAVEKQIKELEKRLEDRMTHMDRATNLVREETRLSATSRAAMISLAINLVGLVLNGLVFLMSRILR